MLHWSAVIQATHSKFSPGHGRIAVRLSFPLVRPLSRLLRARIPSSRSYLSCAQRPYLESLLRPRRDTCRGYVASSPDGAEDRALPDYNHAFVGANQIVVAHTPSPVLQQAPVTTPASDIDALARYQNVRPQMYNISEPTPKRGDSPALVENTRPGTKRWTIDVELRRRQRFERLFEQLRDELVDHLKAENMPPEAVAWYRRNLDYNVPGGKLSRGMSVVDSVEILKARPLTDDEYLKAALLGWCTELAQAASLVADDMMDKSVTRRGRSCWYRIGGVGGIAINDAFMLECTPYHLLRKHLRQEPYYVHVLELFHETTFRTEMGQLVDLVISPEDRVDLGKFSLQKHALIAQYKTAYYSFYHPVALALHFCGVPESYEVNGQKVRPYDVALSILLPLGEYFQIQDDFLDYANTPEQTGKIGTDIVDGKCSWCINVALEVATPGQRAVLDANYGRRDAEKEAKVKEVYEAIGLKERYRVYEESAKERIERLIAAVPEPEGHVEGVLKREVFTAMLNTIYKRNK